MKLKRTSLISKGSLERTFQAVNEAWKRCDFPAAIEMLERASRLNPSNAGLLLDLGRLHGMRYDPVAAERCFERALRVAPHKSEVLVAAGRQSRDFNDFTLAERYFKLAVEQKDVSPATLAQLADLYERLRRSDEAAGLVDRALHLNPASAPALLLRAKLDRQAGRLEAAEKLLRDFPAGAEPVFRVGAAYELGGILDRQGRYDEAMTAFLEAKSLLQPQAERPAAELKIMRARISHLTVNATADVLRQWFDLSAQLQPPHRLALLGGHPRSGTTLLEQVLDSHPHIVSAEETEIFYNDAFGPLLRGQPDDTAMFSGLTLATTGTLHQVRQNYFRAVESSLGQAVGGRLLIDKNPSYTFLIPALIRIFPEIKLLIALRDPRDVVLSCFMQNLPLNQVGAACLSLTSTVEEYAALMRSWQAIAPRMRNPYLEIRYEDMVADLESVARKTLDFLGAPWDARVLGFDEHARNKTVRSPTYADVTQPVYKRAVGRWRHYQKYLEPHLEKLTPFANAFGYA
ncbi:MAG TPA: sulfotransferase [Verrucomicrobiae bacterium]|jgi:Flp pilus assembly protein TadD|nr:sulfotransferase [Verrucomicrobiae bacterium]